MSASSLELSWIAVSKGVCKINLNIWAGRLEKWLLILSYLKSFLAPSTCPSEGTDMQIRVALP